VDGSDGSDRALEWAAVQAQRTNALLEIHTTYVPGFFFVPPEESSALSQRILANAAERAHHVAPKVVTQGSAHTGEAPADALIEASKGADLLVVGSRGREGLPGWGLGSVGRRCSRHARCPVVIVP
jgi:nucleotide-binding universal stress UspA family protein